MTVETDLPTSDLPTGDFTTDFAAEFPSTEAEWRIAAETALKGRPLDPILNGRLLDGVAYLAIAARAKAQAIAGRPGGQRWTAMTRIDIADPVDANAQALEDLNNGASGLSLIFAQPGEAGLDATTVEQLDQALDGVMVDLAPVHIDAAPFATGPAALVAALIERRGMKAADVSALFGLDLIRDLLRAGGAPKPLNELARDASDLLKSAAASGFASPVLLIDQRLAHDAGASEALELAGALASVVEHIRLLSGSGVEVADQIGLAFSVDANQFAGIAKLRAARLLWAALRRELGLGDRPVHIHAQTSRRMMTRNDPQTNMVRTTIAAFAAGVGGADSIVTLPHTAALGGADADSRRIARNTQAIVLEETNAYRVADPSAGAGAIEQLTDALAERAWALFQEIEALGGMLEAVRSGAYQAMVKAARAKRDADVATRKTPIVGVSHFPKADEAPASVAAVASPKLVAAAGLDFAVETLDDRRLSEPFEALRAANEAKSPRPAVFIALVGPIARHAARAGFMKNLFEAGGVVALDGPIGAEAPAIVEGFKSSGASIAVVTGADADYAETGTSVAKALAAAGATVWLAGRPKDGVAELEAAGVSRFIAAGDDALDILAAASKANGGAS